MKSEIIRGLILNASLLLSISIAYTIFYTKLWKKKKLYDAILGMIVGFVGLILMMNTVRLSTGVIFDTRSILVSVTGLFFGFIPTVIAVIIISGYRIFLGGPGVLMGVAVTILTASAGLLWRKFRWEKIITSKKGTWPEFYLFGLITHIVMLACTTAIPQNIRFETIKQISLPVLLIYPLGSLLLCIVMQYGIINSRTKSDLKESELRFRTMFEQAPIGIAIANDYKIIYVNLMYEKITGMSKEQICSLDWESYTHPDDLEQDKKQYQKLKSGEIESYSMPKRYIKPDGHIVWVNMTIAPLKVGSNLTESHLCMIEDITERKQKEEKILYLNYHDILTGLYNRTFFDKEQRRLDRPDQLPMSFIIGDINGLKIINDAFGHAQGDKLLIETAKILKNCCRARDIIARTGGDEFCIILPKTDSNTAKIIYKKIKTACEEYAVRADKDGYFTSISLGYSTKNSEEEPFDSVYKEAEENMYRRKLLEHKSLHSSLMTSIKTTMFEKSNETEEHAERLADLAKKLGKELGLNDEELVALELASVLHDVGKLSVDQKILKKPGKLNAEEWVEVKKHPVVGYRIAQAVPELRHISEYILCHHERWDGEGYPQGLAGEEIPLLSRILSVVDAYDAMTQDRVYSKAMTKDAAVTEIEKNAGTQFDAHVVSVFFETIFNIDM